MLEILKFIFSNFWIWLGTVILVASLASFRLVDKSVHYDCNCEEDKDNG